MLKQITASLVCCCMILGICTNCILPVKAAILSEIVSSGTSVSSQSEQPSTSSGEGSGQDKSQSTSIADESTNDSDASSDANDKSEDSSAASSDSTSSSEDVASSDSTSPSDSTSSSENAASSASTSSSDSTSSSESNLDEQSEKMASIDAAADLAEFRLPIKSRARAASKITENQLFFQARQYLVNEPTNKFITRCSDYAFAAMEGISTSDIQIASVLESLKSGQIYITKLLANLIGLSDSSYDDFNEKMAAELVKTYLKTNDSMSKGIGNISKSFSKVEKVTNLAEEHLREEYVNLIKEAYPKLPKEVWGEIVDKSWKKYFSKPEIFNYASDALEVAELFTVMIETYTMEVDVISNLMIIQEPNSDLYKGLSSLYVDITSSPAEYVLKHYANDKFIKMASSL